MLLLRTIFIILFFIVSFVGPYKAFFNKKHSESFIEIMPGDSMYAVTSKLASGSLLNKIFFKIYVSKNNINSFQVGEYNISEMNIATAINSFNKGDTFTRFIRINEGINIFDLNKIIDKSFLKNDCVNLSCLTTSYPFNEGILYPDTYFYKKGMKASDILKASHKSLDLKLTELWNKKPKLNLLNNKFDALILASIIEKEAGNHFEKKDIASVFLKRISLGMRLQADPTIIYGLLPDFDGDIKKSDILDKNNRYNTYMIQGLPPTPISIVSISSLEAAVTSVPGDYLFFVADSPTSHYFSKTYKEHKQMISKIGLNK
jgi:UPF0755 protein